VYIALAHKHYAIKFFLAWVAFAVADALWLDELSGWLKLQRTRCFCWPPSYP